MRHWKSRGAVFNLPRDRAKRHRGLGSVRFARGRPGLEPLRESQESERSSAPTRRDGSEGARKNAEPLQPATGDGTAAGIARAVSDHVLTTAFMGARFQTE